MNEEEQSYLKNQKLIHGITYLEVSELIKNLDDQVNVFEIKNVRKEFKKYSNIQARVAKLLSMDIQAIINFWKEEGRHIVDFNEEKWPSFKQESLKAYFDFCKEKSGFIDGLAEADQRYINQKNLQYDATFHLYDNLRLYREKAEKLLGEKHDTKPEPPPINLTGGVKEKKEKEAPQPPKAKPVLPEPAWKKHLIDKGLLYPDGKKVVRSLNDVAKEFVRFNKENPTSKFLQENFLKSDGSPYSSKACDNARTSANKNVKGK